MVGVLARISLRCGCGLVLLLVLPLFTASQTRSVPGTGPSKTPRVFAPGVISTGDFESHADFTPDGKTVYFVKSAPNFGFWTIFVSHFDHGTWSAPSIAPFSGQFKDADPCVTPDGKKIFFISNRPVTRGERQREDMDIWWVDILGPNRWVEPKRLPEPVNSEKNEWYPRVAGDGTLYFGSERAGGFGGSDIWRARRGINGTYQAPENLGPAINSGENEYEAYVPLDQSYLILMAWRKEGMGRSDLYISFFKNGSWTKAKNLGAPINSEGSEYSPNISPDGKYFFFASTKPGFDQWSKRRFGTQQFNRRLHSPGNGLGDIYYVDVGALGLGAK